MTQRYLSPLIFLFFILPGCFSALYAQKDTTRLNQEVEVVKAYRPSVSNAEKISILPEIGDTTKFRPGLNYSTGSHPITEGFQSSDVKAYNQFKREVTYPGIGKINGGFGSYLTPFADFYLSNPNSQNGTIGVQLNHLSSMGTNVLLKGGSQVDAPFSYNRVLIFGSYVAEGVTISSELAYQRDMNRFYGYPVAIPDNIMTDNFVKYFNQDQMNQLGYFDLTVKNNAVSSANLRFKAGVNLGYFNTSTDQVEKAMKFNSEWNYNFGTFAGKLKADIEHFDIENVTTYPDLSILYSSAATWIQLSPALLYQNESFSLEGGLNLYSTFDNSDESTFKPYPKVNIAYHTDENKLTFYAGMDGFLQNNNYSKIAAENRWINPTLKLTPTNNLNIFSAGIKGKITAPLTFDLGIKYSKKEDQYFYVTRIENNSGNDTPALIDLTYNNAFEVEYDNLKTLDFSGNITYTTPGLFLLLSGHFFSYEVSWLDKALYMPDFTLNAVSRFTVNDKISATAEVFLTGPRNIMLKYYVPPVSSMMGPPPIYLKEDAMAEVNIGAKYLFAKDLELFGRIENLLNRKDEPWYGYTVQGIRFKVGVSFSF